MNKKGEERATLRGVIKASVKGMFQNDFFFSIAQNISTTGILLEAEKNLARGDKIICSFVLQHKISVTGEVVRVEKKASDLYNYGVRFLDLDLDPKSKAQIEEVVKSQKRC